MLKRTVIAIRNTPLIVIEATLAVTLVLYGLYIGSPFYIASASTALGQFFDFPVMRGAVSLGYFIPGILGLFGVISRQPRPQIWGALTMSLSFLYSTLLRIITIGWTPLYWILTGALSMTAAVIYLHLKWVDSHAE